jgi:hypothetical protein
VKHAPKESTTQLGWLSALIVTQAASATLFRLRPVMNVQQVIMRKKERQSAHHVRQARMQRMLEQVLARSAIQVSNAVALVFLHLRTSIPTRTCK